MGEFAFQFCPWWGNSTAWKSTRVYEVGPLREILIRNPGLYMLPFLHGAVESSTTGYDNRESPTHVTLFSLLSHPILWGSCLGG
jgi:hypothetical protein